MEPIHEDNSVDARRVELDTFFNELKEEYELKTGTDWVPPTNDKDWIWDWEEEAVVEEEDENGVEDDEIVEGLTDVGK
jgi:hypothetical protein